MRSHQINLISLYKRIMMKAYVLNIKTLKSQHRPIEMREDKLFGNMSADLRIVMVEFC